MRRSILLSRVDTTRSPRSSVLSLRMAGSIPFSRRKRNSIDNCVNPEHRSLNDFISPSKTLGADKKGFSSINFRFAFVYRSRANGRIVADHLERYFGEASSTRISAESNIWMVTSMVICDMVVSMLSNGKVSREEKRSTYLSDLQL